MMLVKTLTAVAVVFMLSAKSLADGYQDWCKQRDATMKDPSLLAYYTFEENNGVAVRNLADGSFDLWTEELWLTSGRWPGKSAARMHAFGYRGKRSWQVYLYSPYLKGQKTAVPGLFAPEDKKFTAECWFRKSREGFDAEKEKTMPGIPLMSVNEGDISGWSVSFSSLKYSPRPDLGQMAFYCAQQGGPIKISGIGPVDDAWHHWAVTCDGETMRVYLDGKEAAAKPFPGKFSKEYLGDAPYAKKFLFPDRGNLTLGPHPWDVEGSMTIAVDEVAIFNRALSADEIARRFLTGGGAFKDKNFTDNFFKIVLPSDRLFKKRHSNGSLTSSWSCFYPREEFSVECVASGMPGRYKAEFSVIGLDGTARMIAKNELALEPGKPNRFDVKARAPETCGVYWLRAKIQESSGLIVYQRDYPFNVIVRRPPLSEVSADSPLGSMDITASETGLQLYGDKWRRVYTADCEWPSIEKRRGLFDWTKCDGIVEAASRQGNAIIFTIQGVPGWASSASAAEIKENHKGKIWLPKEMRDWEYFVNALVFRYKDKIHHWEILNEPDACLMPRDASQAGNYVKFLKSAYEVIKSVDPSAKVAGCCSFSCRTAWPEAVFKAGGAPYMDILTFHYPHVYGNPSVLVKERKVESLRELVEREAGKRLPLWTSETGYMTMPWVENRPVDEEAYRKYFAGDFEKGKDYICSWVHMLSEERSTAWDVQAAMCDFAAGVAKRIGFDGDYRGLRGVANAAMASVVSDLRSASFLSLGCSDAMGVILTAKDMRQTAVLWSTSPQTVPVDLAVEPKKLYGGMDYLGNPLEFKAADGVVRLRLTATPVYVFLGVPPKPPEAKVAQLTVEFRGSARPAEESEAEIIVRNNEAKEFKGTVELVAPAGWLAAVKDGSLSVAPGKIMCLRVALKAPDVANGFYPLEIKLKDSSGGAVKWSTAQCLVKKVLPLDNAAEATLLGTADSSDEALIGRPDVIDQGRNPFGTGPNDLSFTVKARWRPGSIYFRVDVVDDDLVLPPGAENQWNYDGVELFLGAPVEDRRGKAVQLLITPSLGKEMAPCRVVANNLGDNPGLGVVCAGKRTSRGYVVEGVISLLPGSSLTIAAGACVDMAVAVDDNGPVPGSRKTQMVLFAANQEFYKSPATWGRFVLREAAKP